MLQTILGLIVTGSLAAPLAPQKAFPKPVNKGHIPAKGKATKKKSAPQPTEFAASEYTGVVSSIRVDKDGDIQEIYFKLAGNTRTIRIKGCGTKSAGQPLLNWAFTERRVVYIVTDGNQCFSAATVKR